jgi:predicted DsbA family dithiol-disulfide isomerase
MSDAYTLYSDFNCPFCYAMHERLHAMNLLHRCEWRGVQHVPHLSKPMARWSGTLGAELRHEVTLVQRLAPGLAIPLPPGKPNTQRAVELAVSLLRQDIGRGMEFVRQAYRAFWCEGEDLSDPTVLNRLAQAIEASLRQQIQGAVYQCRLYVSGRRSGEPPANPAFRSLLLQMADSSLGLPVRTTFNGF